MRYPWWRRPLAALLAAWLVGLVVEPAVLHACPLHDYAPGTAPAAPGVHTSVDGAHGHARSPSPQHPDHRSCTCLGDCCGASVLAEVRSTTVMVVIDVVATPPQRTANDAAYRPTTPEYARPPSIGPPAFHIG